MSLDKLDLNPTFDPLYTLDKDNIPILKMFIGGEWVPLESRDSFEVRSPIDSSVVAKAPRATKADLDRAVDSAKRAQGSIENLSGMERLEIFETAKNILTKSLDEFTKVIMLEGGKLRKSAHDEAMITAERMKMTMQEARKFFGEYIPGDWSEDTMNKVALVVREPVGVIGSISPFNYSLYIGAAKIIPALLAGNSVVAKQSSLNPISLLMFAKVLADAGLPRGTLNVITGSGEIGDMLVQHPDVSMISFTGSTEVGKQISARAGFKKLHLELGGKALAIILDDANLSLAAEKSIAGALKGAGQRCDAVSCILVVESVADKFLDLAIKEIEKIKLGDPRDATVKLGPVINEKAAQRINDLVEDAILKGAQLVKGGKYTKNYYEATLLDRVPPTARIVWEETFGPVAPIVRVSSEEEALSIGEKSRFGLDSCVFTNNFYRMLDVARRLKVGAITINDFPVHGQGFFPFGGVKDSGKGREGIWYSLDEVTELKTVVINLETSREVKMGHYF